VPNWLPASSVTVLLMVAVYVVEYARSTAGVNVAVRPSELKETEPPILSSPSPTVNVLVLSVDA
jgi:hypothetical protein